MHPSIRIIGSLACTGLITLSGGCVGDGMTARLAQHSAYGCQYVPEAVCRPNGPDAERDEHRAPPEHFRGDVLPVGFEQPTAEPDGGVDTAATQPAVQTGRPQGQWMTISRAAAASAELISPPDIPPAPDGDDDEPSLTDLAESPPPVNTIDFGTALALVSGQNPQVAFAQERVNEAFARWDAARALWLPSLRGGASYNKHEGSLQDVRGEMLDLSRGSVFTGFGARAIGAGSPAVPGVSAQFHLADAFFQPIIAERTTAARQHRANAVTNDELLNAAVAYVDLQRAVQAEAIAIDTLRNAEQLAKQTESFAETGEAPQSDADRMRTELALRQNEVIRAREAVQIASARLAEVLSLDVSSPMQPAEPTVAPIELVDADSRLEELVAVALSNRPELCETQFLTSAAHERFKRERYAPFVPNLAMGLSYGGYGGGVGGDVDRYRDRLDFDAVAYWEVRNLGVGEQAARDEAHALVHQAQHREVQISNQVSREVAEAFAQVQSSTQQIGVAEKGITAAEDSYRRNMERIRAGQGLPIEVLQSLQALDQARREYLRTVTDYNRAQFRLHRALGWPLAE